MLCNAGSRSLNAAKFLCALLRGDGEGLVFFFWGKVVGGGAGVGQLSLDNSY
jgi:hypothetical protein